MNQMKKGIKPIIAVVFMTLLLGIGAYAEKNNTNNLGTNQVHASSITIPKKMRGTWKSKPQYSFESKHINKNMAVPAMKMKVSAKKVKWHFIGYVPSGYDHRSHIIRLVSLQNGQPVLKGHGPYRDDNYLQMSGKVLTLGYHGGFNNFTKVKK